MIATPTYVNCQTHCSSKVRRIPISSLCEDWHGLQFHRQPNSSFEEKPVWRMSTLVCKRRKATQFLLTCQGSTEKKLRFSSFHSTVSIANLLQCEQQDYWVRPVSDLQTSAVFSWSWLLASANSVWHESVITTDFNDRQHLNVKEKNKEELRKGVHQLHPVHYIKCIKQQVILKNHFDLLP